MSLLQFVKPSVICRKIALLNNERVVLESTRRFLSKDSKDPKDVFLDGHKEENSVVLAKKEQVEYIDKLRTTKINVDDPNLLSTINGVPEEHITTRRARIYKPAKNAMQSGTFDTKKWKLDFENRERWENPLMGWTSTGDPYSNLNLWFTSKEDAIAYCQNYGLTYEVDEPQERRNLKKLYADNYSWNKRTRVGSK